MKERSVVLCLTQGRSAEQRSEDEHATHSTSSFGVLASDDSGVANTGYFRRNRHRAFGGYSQRSCSSQPSRESQSASLVMSYRLM